MNNPLDDLASSYTQPSDVRVTPPWLADIIREFSSTGRIGLDVCTTSTNPLGAVTYYEGHRRNGLVLPWLSDGVVYSNPPYSRGQVIQWATKAIAEARLGVEILMLTKADPRTAWNRLLVANADARCAISRGVGFLEPDGDGGFRQMPGPSWGSCIWYFGRRRRRFDEVFSRIGEVTHFLGPGELTT